MMNGVTTNASARMRRRMWRIAYVADRQLGRAWAWSRWVATAALVTLAKGGGAEVRIINEWEPATDPKTAKGRALRARQQAEEARRLA